MKYQCKRCDRVIDIPKKQTNGGARKIHACEQCNDMTNFERLDYSYEDLTDAQRHFLRSIHTEIRVTTTSKTQKRMHINHLDDTLCNHDIDTRLVDIKAYPLGYLDWCEHCLKRSKNPRKGEPTSSREDIVKAIQYANSKVEGKLTREKYNELNVNPSVWTIRQVFGQWSTAKEQAL